MIMHTRVSEKQIADKGERKEARALQFEGLFLVL